MLMKPKYMCSPDLAPELQIFPEYLTHFKFSNLNSSALHPTHTPLKLDPAHLICQARSHVTLLPALYTFSFSH